MMRRSSRQARGLIPPMGQGLAVLASLAAIAVLSIGGIVGYMLSLHVAAANHQNRLIDAKLLATRQDIRQLNNELDVRSRFVELERWGTTLGLQAPDSRQYVLGRQKLLETAEARRLLVAERGDTPPLLKAPCAGSASPDSPVNCAAGPASGHGGYAPVARKQMDSLIGDVLR